MTNAFVGRTFVPPSPAAAFAFGAAVAVAVDVVAAA